MDWARMLAYVTGTVDRELLARNEYLIAENRILKAHLNGRLKLSDAERSTLGEIGHRLGRTALAEVATVACLSKVILFGERSVRRALSEYVDHYHEERNHQGKDTVLLFPRNRDLDRERARPMPRAIGRAPALLSSEAA
jgi:hypothetical protein